MKNILKKQADFISWFDEDKRKMFLNIILIGVIANIVFFTSDLLCADGIFFSDYYIGSNWDVQLGRWFLTYLGNIRFALAIPCVSGILALIVLSMSNILLIDLFEIKNKFIKYLTGLLLVCSPFFTETLFSAFCSMEFTFAFLFAILSVYILYKKKNGIFTLLMSAFSLALALGLYQAYIGVAAGLCIFIPLTYLIRNKISYKEIVKKFLLSLLMGVCAIILYEILLNIVLNIYGIELATYSGANEIGITTILKVPSLIKDTYISFYHYFFDNGIVNNNLYYRPLINIVLFSLLFISLINYGNKTIKCKRNGVVNLISIILLVIITPVALGIIELIVCDRNINTLMSSPFVLVYIFNLSLCDDKKFFGHFDKICILCICFIALTYFIMANATSNTVKSIRDKTLHVASEIVNVYEMENNKLPLMIAGNGDTGYLSNVTYYDGAFLLSSQGTASYPQIWKNNNINVAWKNFINYYLGTSINFVDLETYNEIIKTKEFESLSIYPSRNSYSIINGVFVVRLEEDAALK